MTYLLFVDGDRVGAQIEGALAAGDLEAAAQLSNLVAQAINEIVRLLEAQGGRVVFVGGDNVLAYASATDELVGAVLDCYAGITGGRSASIGVGATSREAYLALKIAKCRGGGRVCWWNRLNTTEHSGPTLTTNPTNASLGDRS